MTLRLLAAFAAAVCGLIVLLADPANEANVLAAGVILAAIAAVIDR